ncbi:MAG: hypothetical protein HWN67_08455 [Candidatus Helarchaeota archaeon]|nr:hypothetical protein [Candidatus Helarchaeota archaeon]
MKILDLVFTGDELSRIYATIFSYIDENGAPYGGIVSPGRVHSVKVKELINNTATYLSAFNSFMEDYAGSTLFSAEFLLEYVGKEDKLLPKGILLITGSRKTRSDFILAFEYETGLIDVYKAKNELNTVCENIYQIEEEINRPQIDNKARTQILERYSSRSAQKMFGIFIEKKWQRTYKEGDRKKSQNLDQVDVDADNVISGNQDTNYITLPPEINLKNIKLSRLKEKSEDKASIQYLKHALSPITAKRITQNTFSFSREAFLPLNELSGNMTQSRFLSFFLDYFIDMIGRYEAKKRFDFLIPVLREEVEVYRDALKSFQASAEEYFKSGIKTEFNEHVDKFKNWVLEKSLGQQKSLLIKIFEEFIGPVREELGNKEIAAWEFKPELNFFIEYANHSISNLIRGLPIFLSKNCEVELLRSYIRKFKEEVLKDQEETIKAIADTYLNKFESYASNEIYKKHLEEVEVKFDQDKIEEQLPKELMIYMENFVEEQNLTLADLIDFSGNFILPRVDSEDNKKLFSKTFNNLKSYPREVLFLTEYLLRYSVFNTFLFENEEKVSENPDSFSEEYLNFLDRRLTAMKLNWNDLLLNWIDDFRQENIDKEKLLFEQVNNFINFIKSQGQKQLEPKIFLQNLEISTEMETDEIQKALLKLFSEIFQQSVELRNTFPSFLNNNFKNFLQNKNLKVETIEPKKILLNETESFQEFQENFQVKAYSKFIVKPILLILQNKKIPELQYQMKFGYYGEKKDKIRVNVGSNFSMIQKPWM